MIFMPYLFVCEIFVLQNLFLIIKLLNYLQYLCIVFHNKKGIFVKYIDENTSLCAILMTHSILRYHHKPHAYTGILYQPKHQHLFFP